MHRLVLLVLAVGACKGGGNRYEELARQANAAHADAGEVVKPAPAEATLIASHQNGPRQILVDSDAVYWLNDGSRGEGEAGLMKASKSGGPVKTLVGGDGIFAFAADASTIYYLAAREGKVLKVAKSGGTPEVIAETSGIMRGIAVDDANVYWPENEGIFKMPKAGGKQQQAIVKEIISPDYLTIDESNAYWYSSLSGNVLKASKSGRGGTGKVYSNDKNTLHTIFVDGPDLFFTFGSVGKMEIYRMPKGGGGAMKLGAGLEPGSDYTTDDHNVYWVTEDGLYKIPRSGGSATQIVSKTDRARNIAVDGTSVYWTDRGGRVQKMPK